MRRGKNTGQTAMPARTFFIDSENNIWKLFEGMELLTSSDAVVIFHRDAFPKNLRSKLETTPAKLEWIKCVDAGVKNSMDVQLIAEFAMRVAKGTCRTAYIVSEDNGFSPAIHYLQRAVTGEDFEMAHVKSIETGIARSIVNGMEALKAAETVDEVRAALARVYGAGNAAALTERLAAVFAGCDGELPQVERCTYHVTRLDDDDADDAEGAAGEDEDAAGADAADAPATEAETGAAQGDAATEADSAPAAKPRKPRSRRSRRSSKTNAAPTESEAPAAPEAEEGPEAKAADENVAAPEPAEQAKESETQPEPAAAEPAADQEASVETEQETGYEAEHATADTGEEPSLISLKGIGKTAVAKLALIGIETPSQLREAGAVQAWVRVKAADDSFAIRWLYAFDGAIEGVGADKVTRKRRAALKAEAEAALAAMAGTETSAETD